MGKNAQVKKTQTIPGQLDTHSQKCIILRNVGVHVYICSKSGPELFLSEQPPLCLISPTSAGAHILQYMIFEELKT